MDLQPKQLSQLTERAHVLYGHDFRDYCPSSLKRRVERTMAMQNYTDFDLFLQAIEAPELFAHLFDQLSINVTSMFRNPKVFAYLREQIIPQLAEHPHIRIWCAGVATGEEPWSMAILLQESGLLERSLIYATDFNAQVLAQAAHGQFKLPLMAEYTTNYIASGGIQSFSIYYDTNDTHAIFNPTLKQNIIFANHNLATDSVFHEFHLILCRNVLIYFNPQLTDKALEVFNGSLISGGHLLLGDKENINGVSLGRTNFSCVHPKYKLFKHTPNSIPDINK